MDLVFLLILVSIYIYSLVWVYRDARRHGRNSFLLTLLAALVVWPVGLLIYRTVSNR